MVRDARHGEGGEQVPLMIAVVEDADGYTWREPVVA